MSYRVPAEAADSAEASLLPGQEPALAPMVVPEAAAATGTLVDAATAGAVAAVPSDAGAAAAGELDGDCVADSGSVCRSVYHAKRLLGGRGRAAGTGDRLLAPVLTARPTRVCCAIQNMQQQVRSSAVAG